MPLQVAQGDSFATMQSLTLELQADAIYVSEAFEPHYRTLDARMGKAMKQRGIQYHITPGNVLIHPEHIKTRHGGFYKVFTPFWKETLSVLSHLEGRSITQPDLSKLTHIPISNAVTLDTLGLKPKHPNWAQGFEPLWTPGEKGAHQRLGSFIRQHISEYKEGRDYPSQDLTSRLSPHLRFGEIHPWEVFTTAKEALSALDPGDIRGAASIQHFISELGWREFSYHLLYHCPALHDANFNPLFDKFQWTHSNELFARWQNGETGYPIVDAGMRELWHTGYMHNRVRMIVASFLTKHLLIDWRKGAAWFWDTLLDADLANNSASWQWVAGCGADAAPFFRIFNPMLQGEKFDPEFHYISKWIPELRNHLSHQPWTSPPLMRPTGYCLPIVEHSSARDRAMKMWHDIKS
jgi:deoxyribodipyrimidine photo-lyase